VGEDVMGRIEGFLSGYHPDLEKYFLDIESNEFAAEAMLASGYRMFIEIISKNSTVQLLKQSIKSHPTIPDKIIKRIMNLTTAEFDEQYENPGSTALATYTWILSQVDRDAGMYAAQLIINAKQTWDARHVAEEILGS
jgi:hypothetical protein